MAEPTVKSFKNTFNKWWKKPLAELKVKEGFPEVSELEYAGTTKVYSDIETIRRDGLFPNEARIVKFVNASLFATAKQKAMGESVKNAGLIEPTAANDPQIRLRAAYDSFMANFPTDEARKDPANIAMGREMASKFLNIAWEDDDDEDDE